METKRTQEEHEISDEHIEWMEKLHRDMGDKIAELKEKRRKNIIKLVD